MKQIIKDKIMDIDQSIEDTQSKIDNLNFELAILKHEREILVKLLNTKTR